MHAIPLLLRIHYATSLCDFFSARNAQRFLREVRPNTDRIGGRQARMRSLVETGRQR